MAEPTQEAEHSRHLGDDIGITNLSCYSEGLMGYRTPNIIASQEGMRFTDAYGGKLHRGPRILHHRQSGFPPA
jgi:hypothetical protein